MMAGLLLEMAGKYKPGKGLAAAREILESGRAWKKMNEIIEAQGKKSLPKLGQFGIAVKSGSLGRVKEIDNEVIAKIARIAGAPDDQGAGLFIVKKVHDLIKKGDLLYTVYAENRFKQGLVQEFLKENKGYVIR